MGLCRYCREYNPNDAHFCHNCGRREPERAEQTEQPMEGALLPNLAAEFWKKLSGTTSDQPVDAGGRLNINLASEEQIASLPGVGPILAKKAVILRAGRGAFRDIDEFGAALGLQPYMVDRLRRLTVFTPVTTAPARTEKMPGRIID